MEKADVEVEVDMWDAIGVPGELERELGVDCVGPNEAIEESRSLEGIFEWDTVEGTANVWSDNVISHGRARIKRIFIYVAGRCRVCVCTYSRNCRRYPKISTI